MKYLMAIIILGFIAWRVAVSENLMWDLIGVPLLIIGYFLVKILAVAVFATARGRWLAIFAGIILFGFTAYVFVAVPFREAFGGNFFPLMFIIAGGFFLWARILQRILQEVKSHNARLVIVIRRLCELERSRDKDISYRAGLLNERLRVEVEQETILHHDLIDNRTVGDHSESKLARHEKMRKVLIEIEGKVATLWEIVQRSDESSGPAEPNNVPEYVKRAERTARTAIDLMARKSHSTSTLDRWYGNSLSNDARRLVDRLESEREAMLKKEEVTEAFEEIEGEVTALASKVRELGEGHTE